jgi:hypothetical protein
MSAWSMSLKSRVDLAVDVARDVEDLLDGHFEGLLAVGRRCARDIDEILAHRGGGDARGRA